MVVSRHNLINNRARDAEIATNSVSGFMDTSKMTRGADFADRPLRTSSLTAHINRPRRDKK